MKKMTHLLALLCCLLLVVGLTQPAAAYSNDLIDGWAIKEVTAMADLGLIPQELAGSDLRLPISRRLMCQIAMLSYEKLTGQTVSLPQSHPFTDTTEPAIEKAAAVGLTDGDGDGKFRPNDTLTRQEFFCFVGKFLKVIQFPLTDDLYADLSGFSDTGNIARWAKDYTALCVGTGVVQGTGNGLAPTAKTKAEEAIMMFYRAYQLAVSYWEKNNENNSANGPSNGDSFAQAFPNTSSWAVPEIQAMEQLGLIPSSVKGTSMQGPITRGSMCKMAVSAYRKLSNQPNLQPSQSSPFQDTQDPDIVLAAELKIVNGYTDGTFGPNKSITREEYFKITMCLLSALGYPYQDDQVVNLGEFGDGNSVSNWAKPSARLLISLGLLKGSGGNLNPKTAIVCQEAIALFYRSYQFMSVWDADSQADPRPPVSRQLAEELVDHAMQFEGYPYVYGGQSPSGFDCSGFVWYNYKQFGYSLNRTADRQYSNGTPVRKSELLPGDLVFFTQNGSSISHVGIYVGNNIMLHASTSSTGVILSDLSSSYYLNHYYGAVRIIAT